MYLIFLNLVDLKIKIFLYMHLILILIQQCTHLDVRLVKWRMSLLICLCTIKGATSRQPMVEYLVVGAPPTRDSRIIFKIRKWPLAFRIPHPCPRLDIITAPLRANVDSSLFLPLPLRRRPVQHSGIDNGMMQVPRCRNAWRWFPPFTQPGEPGQPRAAMRAVGSVFFFFFFFFFFLFSMEKLVYPDIINRVECNLMNYLICLCSILYHQI
ncbi:hypothetical protein PUN28_005973 [Cardiocondyla obscurior]|uniref:Uncharacterized protein n=1 Tax=Cardiocondyla obscurior TaxID=286306 RepID=A0AAW2G8X7_9HYME